MTTRINASTSGLTETVDTSGILEIQTANSAAIIIDSSQNANFAGSGAITVPVGTTDQRPAPVNGMMRYNSNLSIFEVYANNSWSAANVSPAPTNTVAPVISGSAIVGQNLACTTGTWSGTPTGYYYQWLANSTAISGQTANVITLTLTENGANITCNVTAQNVAGNSSPATSNTLGPVIQGTTVNYLIVAGGGGGGNNYGNLNSRGMGGGGAGGYLAGTTILQPANTYSITVGAGGAGGIGIAYPSTGTQPTNGSNTTFTGLTTAVGGGAGATSNQTAKNGGSGGGGCADTNATGGSASPSGQGYAGGNSTDAANTGGAGGGGSSSVGVSVGSGTGTGGAGGNGTSSTISGVASTYAVGGTGGASSGAASGSPANASTGNGGTGAAGFSSGTPPSGGAGGSGIVIVSYSGAQQFGGGVVSTDGSNTIHTFYTSGSLVPLTALSASYLIVAGGGSGGTGAAGGGGAGGLLSGSSLIIDSSSTYPIVVGSGGSPNTGSYAVGGSGSNSSFSMVSTVAVGGGGGGSGAVIGGAGVNGGSGGGGGDGEAASSTAGGTGISGQGYAGGTGTNNGSSYTGGGGGGAAEVGFNAGNSGVGAAGGNGVSSTISGTATYYAGGGGGFGYAGAGTTGVGGAGGLGGGGTGASNANIGVSGTANTGGGGGGGGGGGAAGAVYGGNGGSGVVIISYPGSTPMMAGGNVTVVSNTVVHTFTSSGYLTPFVNFNNSLRFRSSATATLSKTYVTSPTSRTTMTMSAWVKRGALSGGTTQAIFGTGNNYENVTFYTDDTIRFTGPYSSSQQGAYITTAVYRDPAAWYHIVAVYDTTNATAANRMRLYVNGSQVTSFSTQTTSNQNNTTTEWLVPGALSVVGATGGSGTSSLFDGYMTEVRVIDGQALAPTAFGTFNQYGVWQPIAYSGSYGTNGFYLPFTNTANTTALGYDFSPQGNNWTTNNISLTAGATYDSMTDVPTLTSANVANYAVINVLDQSRGSFTTQNANLQFTATATNSSCAMTMFPTSGKYYAEAVFTTGASTYYSVVGIIRAGTTAQWYASGGGVYYTSEGYKYVDGTSTAGFGATWATGDIIGVALDIDGGTVAFYVNNSLQGTITLPSSTTGWTFSLCDSHTGGGSVGSINCGQQPFAYTPPSGFLGLNTYNM